MSDVSSASSGASRKALRAKHRSAQRDSVRQFLYIHFALLLSIVALVAVAMKVFVVARGEPTTVAAIASTQGLGGLIAVLLTVGAPIVVGGAFGVSGASVAEAIREGEPISGPVLALCFTGVLSFFLVPFIYFLLLGIFASGMVTVSLLLRLLRWLLQRRGAKIPSLLRANAQPQRLPARWFIAISLTIGLGILVLSDSMWLPKERLGLTDGLGKVGYVLGETGEFTTILVDRERQVEHLHSDEILTRELCGTEQEGQRAIAVALIWPEPPNYPPCP